MTPDDGPEVTGPEFPWAVLVSMGIFCIAAVLFAVLR